MNSKQVAGNPVKRAAPFWVAFTVSLVGWLIAVLLWFTVPLPRLKADGLTRVGQTFTHPDHDLLIYVISGVAVICLGTYLTRTFNSSTVNALQAPLKFNYSNCVVDLIALLAILAFVVVVFPDEIAERSFHKDGLHHLSYYVLGPLQAYRHGAALGTDFYSQYGCGWVFVFVILSKFVTVTPAVCFLMFSLFGSAYFAAVYVLLCLLTRNRLWSLAGLLACLQWQLFSGTDVSLWAYPSSTVLRMPFDVLIAILLLSRKSAPKACAVLIGALGGLSILFSTDTGIHVTVALAIYSICLLYGAERRTQNAPMILMWLAWVVTIVVGLWVASFNTIWTSRFWLGYFEAIFEFSSGFSSFPISIMRDFPMYLLLFLGMLIVYSMAEIRTFVAVLHRQATDHDLVIGFVGVIGFGALMVFVNRSHPYNLLHSIVPACLLVTVASSNCLPRRAIAITCSVVLFCLLGINIHVLFSPTLASVVSRLISGQPRPMSPTDLSKLFADAKGLKATLTELKHAGFRAEFVGEDPTLWLMAVDHPPLGRYCPAVLINWKQYDRMKAALAERHPEILVVTHKPALYLENLSYLDERWQLLAQTDSFSIYASPEYRKPAKNSDHP